MGPLLNAHNETRSLARPPVVQSEPALQQELQSLRVSQSAPVWDLLACISAPLPGCNSRSQNKSVLNNIKAPNVEYLKLDWTRDDDTAGCLTAVSKTLAAQVPAHLHSDNTLYFYCFQSREDSETGELQGLRSKRVN